MAALPAVGLAMAGCGSNTPRALEAATPVGGGSGLEAVAYYSPPTPPRPEQPPPTSAEVRAQAAGAGSGTFQVTLVWRSRNDLDLHLITPCESRVFFGSPIGCGVALDVDMNVWPMTDEPVEHMNGDWESLRRGHYEVHVVRYSNVMALASEAFEVELRRGGRVETLRGVVSDAAQEVTVAAFDIP